MASTGAAQTILIVDDDEILRARLARAFRDRDLAAVTAADYESALAVAADAQPQLAVVDLKMPGRSGLELTGALVEAHPNIKVVVLTGYGSIATAIDAVRMGATYYVNKPADVDEILAAFERGRAAFASHTLAKRYRFLSRGDVPWDRNLVTHALAHDKRRKARMIWQRGANTPHRGRWLSARTELLRLQGELWEATLSTGVMHQARVHAAAAGLPILGDRLYGGAPHPAGFHLHHARIDGWPAPTPDLPVPWSP